MSEKESTKSRRWVACRYIEKPLIVQRRCMAWQHITLSATDSNSTSGHD